MANRKLLERVRELVSTPDAWTQGAFARDCVGASVEPIHKCAVSWCLLGAVRRARFEFGILDDAKFTPYFGPEYDAIKAEIGYSPSIFNDLDSTHASMLAMLDRVIAKAS